ncbi:ABC transporter permease [Oerskovia sp. M15]
MSVETSETNWTTQVIGTTEDWTDVRSRELALGDFFTAQDEADQAAVVVLGAETATELFGTPDAVGRSVTIEGTVFSVVGS